MKAEDYQNIQRMIDATLKYHMNRAENRGELLATMSDLDTYEDGLQRDIEDAVNDKADAGEVRSLQNDFEFLRNEVEAL